MLDLAAEKEPGYVRLNYFFGHYFIWCMINNMGGRRGLYGLIHNVNENVFSARHDGNGTLLGTGMTMEGTGTNYIVYELINEMHWRKAPVNFTDWWVESGGSLMFTPNLNLARVLLSIYESLMYPHICVTFTGWLTTPDVDTLTQIACCHSSGCLCW